MKNKVIRVMNKKINTKKKGKNIYSFSSEKKTFEMILYSAHITS